MSEPKLSDKLRQIAQDIGVRGDPTRFHQMADNAALLEAKLEAMERAESILASLADCINLELRESGESGAQIRDYLTTDMRPFIQRLVDANRKAAAQEEQEE